MVSDDQTSILKEILKWIKVLSAKEAKNTLLSVLDSDKKILAYHFSDGKHTAREIVKETGMGSQSVINLWRECTMLGLGDTVQTSGGNRFVKSFDLSYFGIQIPNSKNTRNLDEKKENK